MFIHSSESLTSMPSADYNVTLRSVSSAVSQCTVELPVPYYSPAFTDLPNTFSC